MTVRGLAKKAIEYRMNISLSEALDLLNGWSSSLSPFAAIFRLPFASGILDGFEVVEPDEVSVGSVDSRIRFEPSEALRIRYIDIREWKDAPSGALQSTLSFDFNFDGSSVIAVYESAQIFNAHLGHYRDAHIEWRYT
jgi:hypothetical protein